MFVSFVFVKNSSSNANHIKFHVGVVIVQVKLVHFT